MRSNIQLTLERLRDELWTPTVVESRVALGGGRRFKGMASFTRDLFGIFDVLAVRDRATIAVQVTSVQLTRKRAKKMMASTNLRACMSAGWRCEIWGWKKDGNRWCRRRVKFEFSNEGVAIPIFSKTEKP